MREGDFVVIAWQQMSNIVRTRLVDGEGAAGKQASCAHRPRADI